MATNLDQIQKNPITANGDYDFSVTPGRIYWFEVFYASGTGTFTVSQQAPNGTTYQNATLPSDPSSAMAITATGVARGFDLRATGDKIRFTVASATGLVAYIRFGEAHNGRS